MNRDEEAKDPRLFDRRIVERNIRSGLVTRKDYEKFVKSLDDAAEKMVPLDDIPAEPGSTGGRGHGSAG